MLFQLTHHKGLQLRASTLPSRYADINTSAELDPEAQAESDKADADAESDVDAGAAGVHTRVLRVI